MRQFANWPSPFFGASFHARAFCMRLTMNAQAWKHARFEGKAGSWWTGSGFIAKRWNLYSFNRRNGLVSPAPAMRTR